MSMEKGIKHEMIFAPMRTGMSFTKNKHIVCNVTTDLDELKRKFSKEELKSMSESISVNNKARIIFKPEITDNESERS